MVGEWPVRPVPMLLMTEEGGPLYALLLSRCYQM
jgi:hypothetical protein